MASDTTLNDASIRRHYDEQSRKWYFSVVDTIAITTDSSDARNYWKVLKNRLYKAHPELVTNCNQLKMKARDGKSYLTDAADSETMLEIIATISSDSVTPLRLYFEKIEATYPHGTKDFLQTDDDFEEGILAIDMHETPTAFTVTSFVAGSPLEDVFISVTYKSITIKGKRIIPQKSEGYVLQEIYWGRFSRTIDLPAEIHIDTVEARMAHGLLSVTLPKIDTLRMRIIKIKSL